MLNHLYTTRTRGVPPPARIIKQRAVPKELREDVIASYHDLIAEGADLDKRKQ